MPDTPNLPSFVNWPSFPFDGQLRTKRLEAPVPVEPPREGDDPSTCSSCKTPDSEYIWVSDRWRVRSTATPSGLPMVLVLESRSHLDLGDLPNLHAAELGVMTVRLERAIRSLEGVERVHVNRWGDGSAHFHQWFYARPTGYLQLRGSFLPMWDDILPQIDEPTWRENLAHVAAWLADFGGQAIAEPPRIVWHAPSSFSEVAATAQDETSEEAPEGVASEVSESNSEDGSQSAASAGEQEPVDSTEANSSGATAERATAGATAQRVDTESAKNGSGSEALANDKSSATGGGHATSAKPPALDPARLATVADAPSAPAYHSQNGAAHAAGAPGSGHLTVPAAMSVRATAEVPRQGTQTEAATDLSLSTDEVAASDILSL